MVNAPLAELLPDALLAAGLNGKIAVDPLGLGGGRCLGTRAMSERVEPLC
jgi:hypothetical protein